MYKKEAVAKKKLDALRIDESIRVFGNPSYNVNCTRKSVTRKSFELKFLVKPPTQRDQDQLALKSPIGPPNQSNRNDRIRSTSSTGKATGMPVLKSATQRNQNQSPPPSELSKQSDIEMVDATTVSSTGETTGMPVFKTATQRNQNQMPPPSDPSNQTDIEKVKNAVAQGPRQIRRPGPSGLHNTALNNELIKDTIGLFSDDKVVSEFLSFVKKSDDVTQMLAKISDFLKSSDCAPASFFSEASKQSNDHLRTILIKNFVSINYMNVLKEYIYAELKKSHPTLDSNQIEEVKNILSENLFPTVCFRFINSKTPWEIWRIRTCVSNYTG